MDLTTCRQCGVDVEASVTTCPNCGALAPGRRSISPAALAVLGLVGVLFVLIMTTDLGPALAKRLSSNRPSLAPRAPARGDSLAAERTRVADQKRAESWRINSIASDAKASCRNASVERATRLVRAHEDWSNQDLIQVICKAVWVGMTANQLRAAWGNPQGINRSSTGFQQWVYGTGTYVYLEGSLVTSWQTFSH